MSEPPRSTSEEFERRYALWAELHARFGSARAYPYAWRLPDLARQADATARSRAALALARTLYAMGRFGEALEALPAGAGEQDPATLELRAHCLWLMGEGDAAWERVGSIVCPDPLDTLRVRAAFAQFTGDPALGQEPILAYRANARGPAEQGAWAALFEDWLRPQGDAAAPHAALAWLRRHQPARAAEAEAVHAEARFRQAPAQALVWLDHALDQTERYGQHHLKARLLRLKALALEASGQLGAAARFMALAREVAQRQGAWRYVRDMAL